MGSSDRDGLLGLPARRGTAMAEALLILIPLLLLAGLAPFVAGMFLDMQTARTEAHRDMLDKTHTILILPDSVMKRSLQAAYDARSPGGKLTEETRLHSFAEVPSVPTKLANFSQDGVAIDVPAWAPLPLAKNMQLDLFDPGFPNNAVEGWEFIERPGLMAQSELVQLLSYAVSLRSPWTRLGYPWVTSQDMIYEPGLMQSWGDSLQIEDFTSADGIWFRMRLAEHIPQETQDPSGGGDINKPNLDPANEPPSEDQLNQLQADTNAATAGIPQDPP